MQGRDLERWSAHDTTLERDVALTIIDSDHPNRAGILDAARRAAGVEDTRLVRILDVGTQDGSSFIVEEAMSGADTLAAMLTRGALPAEEARRIVGETARGLEIAGRRGLHHLKLTPNSILVAPDGAVRVRGVAVAEAIEGPHQQEPDPAAASRRDAVSLAAVTYAALTSRWPLEEQVFGLDSAPQVSGGVPLPSEIAAGVPRDLDTLCRMTLNEDTGPMTPGELASQIAPWSHEPVHRDGVEPTVALHLPGARQLVPAAGAGAVKAGDTEPTVTLLTRDIRDHGPQDQRMPDGHVQEHDGTIAHPSAAQPEVEDLEPAARSKNGGKAAPRTPRADAEHQSMTLPHALTSPQPLYDGYEDVGPPLPMLPASTARPPSREQSKAVVLIVAAFVVASLLVAYCGVRDLGRGISLPDATAKSPVAAPRATSPASSAPQTGSALPPAGRPIAIVSASGFDPGGDQSEKDSQADRVYDGDASTSWESEGYNSSDFGNLKKGVGVVLDLGEPTSVSQATLDLDNGPVDVTVYAAKETSLDGADMIGEAKDASGRIKLKAASKMPKSQYVIVWFTKVAPAGGKFRSTLSEIALT